MRKQACGTPAPIILRSETGEKVALVPAAGTICKTAAALARWIGQDVQAHATGTLRMRVSKIIVAESYGCRSSYCRSGALSFVLADG